jgi:hypothetical protein
MWNSNGATNSPAGPLQGGYNFSVTWRETLPDVVSIGMGLYNFVTGDNGILSYQTQLLAADNTSAIVNVDLVGSKARMVYLAFSIVVIT